MRPLHQGKNLALFPGFFFWCLASRASSICNEIPGLTTEQVVVQQKLDSGVLIREDKRPASRA